MKAGLVVYNENGGIILDLTTNTTQYLGKGNTNAVDGSLIDARIGNKTVWVAITPVEVESQWGVRRPLFTQNGNTISWVVSPYGTADWSGALIDIEFVYGVY